MAKVHFWHPIWTTCWSLILTKIDIKYLKIPLYNQIVCILCYCTTCSLYKGQKLTKMGENTSIWWSGPLGFGDKVISYNSCIVQCFPLILEEGGGGQWAKSHFGEGGGGQQAKPHFGGVGGGGGQRAKPHLSWIGYYLEMEVIKKADTKLFSLFYISKGKSMQINCIFSKMTKIHNLTPCLWHPIWTTCWNLIFTKIDIKYLKIPLYN